MSHRPLVSVVIPCFNHGRYLRDCLDSVFAQTYSPLEVIVVNDGSTDDSADVARTYGDRIVLLNRENSGVSASRNVGIGTACGDVIALVDADDTLEPDCIARRMEVMLARPDVGIVAGAYRLVDQELKPLDAKRQASLPTGQIDQRGAIRRFMSPNIGVLIRKRAFELCGYFDPNLKNCEDWDFQIRATRKFEHVFVPEIGANYRQLPTSATRDPLRSFDSARKVLKRALVFSDGKLFMRWDCFVGLYNHTLGGVLGLVKHESSGLQRLMSFARLVALRPIIALFMVAIVCRFAWNRSLGRFIGK